MPVTNVRVATSLQFKDGSVYSGQVLDETSGDSTTSVPYGYGIMTTKEGFTQRGYFKHGKSQGGGIFRAPNGDTFYGRWNAHHKRQGKGLFIRSSDALQLIEEYDGEGKIIGKRVKRRIPGDTQTHWLASLDHRGGLVMDGVLPSARSGHSMTLTYDGAMIVIFGGETHNEAGVMQNLNDLHLFDLETNTWIQPQVQGIQPPPMHGHTATLVSTHTLIIIGGQLQGLEANSSVYALDLSTGVWSIMINKGLSFVNHTASYIEASHSIFILVQNSCFELSLNTLAYKEHHLDQRHLKKCPRSFISHTATVVGNDIIVFGGKVLGSIQQQNEGKRYDRCTADVRVLNTETLTWSVPICQSPPPAANSSDNMMCADWSGYTINGSYDTPRCEHTACLIQDRYLVIIGGWSTSNPMMNIVDECWLNDVQILDIETLQWLSSPTITCPVFISPRSCHAAIQIKNQIWMFGGRNAAEETSNEWNVLQLSYQLTGDKPSSSSSIPTVVPSSSSSTSEQQQQQQQIKRTEEKENILTTNTCTTEFAVMTVKKS